MPAPADLQVSSLGECRVASPLLGSFTSTEARIRERVDAESGADSAGWFEKAGPRERIFFDPARTTAAVATCGGLSPGLNNVIRALFYELFHNYGVPRLLGIRFGYYGLNADCGREPVVLTHEFVEDIHFMGGTVLGSSRGAQEPGKMVDTLERAGVNLLFCVGGDGTQRGAHAIYQEVARRKLPLAVVGIPKTIDNDIPYVAQSFGYATAMEQAQEVIRAAHVEARAAINGVGLVKLMGRDAGFIAAGATLVSQEVNFCLVPEVPFPLEGEHGFLAALESRLHRREHAVVVVAEGAGQHLFDAEVGRIDASGNRQHHDIGPFLREKIRAAASARQFAVDVKYFDPSYSIRSVPANSRDRVLSDQMARHAAHAGMAGKTDVVIGYLHDEYVHVPISTVIASKKRLDIHGDVWAEVLRNTRQPRW